MPSCAGMRSAVALGNRRLQRMYSLKCTQSYEEGRDDVLLSLDETKIRAYFAAWNGGVDDLPRVKQAFWCLIHQAITAVRSLPLEFRLQSRRWLVSRGFRPLDGGAI